MKILILSATPKSNATQHIANTAKKRGHEVTIKDPAFLYLVVSESVNGFDAIFDGFDQNNPEKLKSKDFDSIIPRIGNNLSYGASVLEHLNRNLGIFATQTSEGIQTAANKLITIQRLSQNKIRVPRTVLGDRAHHPKWLIQQIGGLPGIAKELTGSQGKQVYPLVDEYQTNVFLKNFNSRYENLLIQHYIDAGAKDIRAIVIDGEVVAAMERTAPKGELRANISQGGSGRKIELSKDDKELCIKAAKSIGLNVAGVDLIKDKTGTSFVIEVNGNYGYKIQEITGIDISTPLIEYCERNYKKGGKPAQTAKNKESIPVGFDSASFQLIKNL